MGRFCFIVLSAISFAHAAFAADWPHWRGPQRDGTTSEVSGWTGSDWPLGLVWSAGVGEGSTSPIIADGKLYTMGHNSGRDHVICLDAKTGDELWRQSYNCGRFGRRATGDQGMYGGPTATPEFDAATNYLYTLSTDGDLQCWDTNNKGKRIWGLNLYEQFNVKQRPQVTKRGGSLRDYGYTSAPLVHESWVIVEVGDDDGNLMAFDKRTGRRAWVSQNKDPAGHTGGLAPMKVDGVDCIAVFTAYHLLVARLDGADAGKTVGEFPWRTDFINSIATPAVSGESVFITSKYNQNAMARLDISLRGGANQVWRQPVASGVCSPVIHNGRLHFANRGFWCVDTARGDTPWDGGKYGDAGSCLLTGDKRFIAWANDGDLTLVESSDRSPGSYRELASRRNVLRDIAWPHVAIADGRIYCKDRAGNIRCFEIGRKGDAPRPPVVRNPQPQPAPNTQPDPPVVPPATDLIVDLDTWSVDAKGLLFAWKRGHGRARAAGAAMSGLPRFRFVVRGGADIARDGAMALTGGSFAADDISAAITKACRASNELTIEAVITPANTSQNGPVRIVSLSSTPYQRHFTLGQERDKLVLRLRTPRTGENGQNPQVTLCGVKAGAAVHVLVTYRDGELACYRNGQRVLRSDAVRGDFSNWDDKQHFILGDEWDGGRDWQGSLDAVAIFARHIDEREAKVRFDAAMKKKQ